MLVPKILAKTTIRTKRVLMIYVSAFLFMFGYTILAYSIATFLMNRFPENPNAILFVGFILGCASFFGIFIDSFWSYLQKIKPARTLTIWALCGLIGTVSIFFLSDFGSTFSVLRWSLFTFIAAFLYGWSFDLYDVTVATTVFKLSKKENLAQNISQKKVAEVLGMIAGLILAGFLLIFGTAFTQIVLIIILIFVTIFFAHHFDNKEDDEEKLEFSEHALADWKKIFLSISDAKKVENEVNNLPDKLKNNILMLAKKTAISLKNLPGEAVHLSSEILEKARWELIEVLSKEGEIVKKGEKKEDFNFKEMVTEVKGTFSDFFSIFGKNFKAPLLWSAICVMIFSFWDTMAITYQPLLLREFSEGRPFLKPLSGFVMVLFITPVFLLQIPFAKLADKIGRHKLMLGGIITSGIAVVILSTTESIIILIIVGMLSGAGYAAAFSPSEAMFVSEFKKFHKIKEGNSGKSAGSLRVALNLGNIFGQFLGGAFFAILGFRGGFLMFGFIFLAISIVSVIFYKKIRPIKDEDEEIINNETVSV